LHIYDGSSNPDDTNHITGKQILQIDFMPRFTAKVLGKGVDIAISIIFRQFYCDNFWISTPESCFQSCALFCQGLNFYWA